MRIGLTGCSGSGKTTLAKEIRKRIGSQHVFVPSVTREVADTVGFDMKATNSIEDRLVFQNAVLDAMEKVYSNYDNFVSDRTPIDAAAYVLADFQPNTGTDEEREAAMQYVDRCLSMTSIYFDAVILVPPGVPYIDEPGRPPNNEAYREAQHFLMTGMLFDPDYDFVAAQIQRDNLAIETRLSSVLTFLNARFPVQLALAA
jgi:predicted ATPase